ncbi:MAG: SRPBCC family protein [Planctomycetota bacterium]
MKILRDITIDASPDRVWEVLGPGYADIGRWMSAVSHSSPVIGQQAAPNAPLAGRTCETDLGPFKESILEYDEEKRVLAYDAQGDSMPFFVTYLANRWSVTGYGNTAYVNSQVTVKVKFPFGVMLPMMRLKLGPVLTHAVEELKHYVETGEPHPRKVAAMNQAKPSLA